MPSWACSQRSLSRLISWSRPVSGDELGRRRRLDRAPGRRDPLHAEELDGLGHALDLPAAEAGALEPALEQPVGGLGADDLAGRGHLLQPDGHVPGVPHQRDRVLLHLHDGRPGVEADPRIQLQVVFAAELLAEGLHVVEEPRPARAARRAASS